MEVLRMNKRYCFLFLFFVLFASFVYSNETETLSLRNAWVSPVFETALYSSSGSSYGGGLALGYGSGACIGFKTIYFLDSEGEVDVLEIGFLLRYYLKGSGFNSGPFVQLTGGQALFFKNDDISLPTNWGILTVGVNLGWRINLGKLFFIEPALRAGYPYLIGGGLSAGIYF